jgi:hypothetical protein
MFYLNEGFPSTKMKDCLGRKIEGKEKRQATLDPGQITTTINRSVF